MATKIKKYYEDENLLVANEDFLPSKLSDLADDSTHRLVTDAEKITWNAKEDASNKSNDIATDGASTTKYPSVKAIKDYADGLVIGLTDLRGEYNATGGTYPTTGGSGTAGAILKGDTWIISVEGTIGGKLFKVGDAIMAIIDTPGQTAGNWGHLNNGLGYVAENTANKVTSISSGSTDIQYPSAKLLYDQLGGKQDSSAGLTSLAGLSFASTSFVKMTSANTYGLDTNTYLTSLAGAVLTDQTSGQTIGNTTNRLTKLWATDIECTNAISGSVTGNAGTASAVAVGGITGLGTGVATALAVNVGTAGAPVVNGGALGTPTSGTVTNLTGTASININGTVGATTPTTGKFTSVETTGDIELGHASDTTLARVNPGIVSIEGSNIMTVGSADTVTGTKTMSRIVLPSDGQILLTVPGADAKVTGPTTNSFQSGYSASAWDLVMMGTGGKWIEVDADAIATCKGLLAISMEAKNDTEAMMVALPGSFIRYDTWNWTVGDILYASETLGGISNAIPTGADGVNKPIGVAVTADCIYFNPSLHHSTVVA